MLDQCIFLSGVDDVFEFVFPTQSKVCDWEFPVAAIIRKQKRINRFFIIRMVMPGNTILPA